MRKNEVFKKIGGILSELNNQYEFLQTVSGDLNDLEIELFVANAHFLADHVEILYKLNLQNRPAELPPEELTKTQEQKKIPEPKYFEPVVQQVRPAAEEPEENPTFTSSEPLEIESAKIRPQEEKPIPQIDLASERTENTHSYMREEEPEVIRHELILDESEIWDDDFTIPEDEEILEDTIDTNSEPVVAKEPEKEKPVPNKFVTEAKNNITTEETITINQKISSQLGNTSAGVIERLSLNPLGDIKAAISLNDKLLFVKELFNGYNLAYSEAIEILNRFTSFEEAMRFLNTNYVTKNNWKSKPETTEKFYAILKRRYA
jgi:hypothetical protein